MGVDRCDLDVRLACGDELRIRYKGDAYRPWESVENVVKIPNSISDEVELKLRRSENAPSDISHGFSIEFIWKSTPFDRMQSALRSFAVDETSISAYIYHRLLGHDVEAQTLKVTVPKKLSAPNLPELNHSQMYAVKTVLQRPLSLLQGPPGTGKTVTSASLVYHLAKQNPGQILVVAPSNVAVDHLTEKIHRTGFKVVRVTARSREALDSAVSFLSLHEQVAKNDNYPEPRKLIMLKNEQGELSRQDENRAKSLTRRCENEILNVSQLQYLVCVG
jgi:regulator of nonsense transcripts 1